MENETGVIFLFGYNGVISNAAIPIIRRYTEGIVKVAVSRVIATGAIPPSFGAVQRLSNLFLDCVNLTICRGITPAYDRLKSGAIRRLQFIKEMSEEFEVFLDYITENDESRLSEITYMKDVNTARQLRNKLSLLREPGYKATIKSLIDVECFLSILEKNPLRKNVLNLLRFLRVNSNQDIKLGVFTNNWERAGDYQATQASMHRYGRPTFVNAYCPIEYKEENSLDLKVHATFYVNSLFDAVIESYKLGVRKPNDIVTTKALEALTGLEIESMKDEKEIREATRRFRIFMFDSHLESIRSGENYRGNPFTSCYYIQNGADDVYNYVIDALNQAGRVDSRWKKLSERVQKIVSPLFKRFPNESWILLEVSNTHGNNLFLPPPEDTALESGKDTIREEIKESILRLLGKKLPQHFPLNVDPRNHLPLCIAPSIATSSGPVIFEHFKQNLFSDACRITLRTGSYIIRFQPGGGDAESALQLMARHSTERQLIRAAGTLAEHGNRESLIKRAYRNARYLRKNTKIPVPKYLYYSSESENEFYINFCLLRFQDGRAARSIEELVSPFVDRPFSYSRSSGSSNLRPRLFVDVAIDLLVRIHYTPIPPYLHERARFLQDGEVHPVYRALLAWKEHCKRAAECATSDIQTTITVPITVPQSLIQLENSLFNAFSNEREVIPSPKRITVVHRTFSLRTIMFSYRSLEGNSRYPPRVIELMNTHSIYVGDPLFDFARFSLLTELPAPVGIASFSKEVRALFPSSEEMLEYYIAKVINYDPGNTIINANLFSMDHAKEFFSIYQSSQCYIMAKKLTYALMFSKNLSGTEKKLREQGIEVIAQAGLRLFKKSGRSISVDSKL